MALIRINRNPSRRQLAVFAVVWFAFFGSAGSLALSQSALPWAIGFWTAASVVPAIGCAAPSFLRIVYVGMAYLTFPIGLVVSHAILVVMYYVVLTPIGLAMRLLGHNPMQRRPDPTAKTYWVAREPVSDTSRYFRQF